MSYNLPVPVWYLLLISENSTLFSDIFSLFSSMVNSVSIRVLLSYRKFGSSIYFFYQVSLHFILGRKREGELNLPVPCLNLFPPRSWGRWPPRPHPYLLSEWVWGHRRKTRSTWHAESWHADDLLLHHHWSGWSFKRPRKFCSGLYLVELVEGQVVSHKMVDGGGAGRGDVY